jgi:hypothetical protein
MSTTRKTDNRFQTEFVRYYQRAKPGGRREWSEDKPFVLDIASDYEREAGQLVRAEEYQDFFLWLQREWSGFADLYQFCLLAHRWDDSRFSRRREAAAGPLEYSVEFRRTLEDYGWAAEAIWLESGDDRFRRVAHYASAIQGVWRCERERYPHKQGYMAMADDGVRVRRFFDVAADLLETSVRMQQLENRKTAYELDARRMAGQPLMERLKMAFAAAKRIGRPMEDVKR